MFYLPLRTRVHTSLLIHTRWVLNHFKGTCLADFVPSPITRSLFAPSRTLDVYSASRLIHFLLTPTQSNTAMPSKFKHEIDEYDNNLHPCVVKPCKINTSSILFGTEINPKKRTTKCAFRYVRLSIFRCSVRHHQMVYIL